VRYFEGAGLGSMLTACYTGAPPRRSDEAALRASEPAEASRALVRALCILADGGVSTMYSHARRVPCGRPAAVPAARRSRPARAAARAASAALAVHSLAARARVHRGQRARGPGRKAAPPRSCPEGAPAARAGLYLVLKCPTVYERLGGLAASARAVLRRSAVYGALVPAGDPGLLESGGACTICQARPTPGPGAGGAASSCINGTGPKRACSACAPRSRHCRLHQSGFCTGVCYILHTGAGSKRACSACAPRSRQGRLHQAGFRSGACLVSIPWRGTCPSLSLQAPCGRGELAHCSSGAPLLRAGPHGQPAQAAVQPHLLRRLHLRMVRAPPLAALWRSRL